MAGAWTAGQTSRFWEVLGEPERAVDARTHSIVELETTSLDVIEHAQRIMRQRTAAEWESLLLEAQVPASRVRTLSEAVSDPQIDHRGTLITQPEGLQHPLAAFKADEHGPSVESPPRAQGADTDQILAEIGIGPEQRAQLRAKSVI
jgi:crotonobetainyl-CoA:carnitine CoA-transferase CaiB-like acyl-CoA transferase